jgi:hypothetical protein
VIGGVAHLLNFDGSDTMTAGYYAQFVLNGGKPVAQSVPASEHRRALRPHGATKPHMQSHAARCRRPASVMTAWATERAALEHMIENFGAGVFACVMDRCACDSVWPRSHAALMRACNARAATTTSMRFPRFCPPSPPRSLQKAAF